MKKAIVDKLNKINNDFYQKTAEDFDETRSQPWDGWNYLVNNYNSYFPTNELSVLDLGCGNGRFLKFISDEFPQNIKEYIGLDSNQKLLIKAKQIARQTKIETKFEKTDLVDLVTENKFFLYAKENGFKPNVVVLFGVLHHIPSYHLRKQLIADILELLPTDGKIILTAWQFHLTVNLMNRHIKLPYNGIEQEDLEDNDFLLDWRRGEKAIRYCHLTSKEEMDQMERDLDFKIIDTFNADGKFGILNNYYIIGHRN